MTPRTKNVAVQIAVVAWAITVATYSQYASFVNYYVVNSDAPNAITWMQRFRDPDVFKNDLLINFSTQIFGQVGFVWFYRALMPLFDPLLVSRFVPVVLLAIFALYTFWFVRTFSTTFAAVIAAVLAIVTPTYLEIMAGGHQRAFALPLLMAFLYYVATTRWRPACVVLVLQALFYPMAFLICVPTYVLALVGPPFRGVSIGALRQPLLWFVPIVLACGLFLSVRNVFAPDPVVGRIVTRTEMEGKPEYYEIGRTRVLPTSGVVRETVDQVVGLARSLSLDYPHALLSVSPGASKALVLIPLLAILAAALLFAGRAVAQGTLVIPPVLLYFVAAGAVMYVLADWLLFRLYLPNRYLIYTIQLSGLLTASLVIGYLVARIQAPTARRAIQLALLLVVAARIDLTRNIGLTDQSAEAPLYEFLRTLPVDAVIASHPYAADFIPTFAHRKVFVNFELSYPFYDNYWRVIRARTSALFDAYYAETREEAYKFCVANNVDYLVVRMRDFQPEYLATHRIYFEPFDSEVRHLVTGRRQHALSNISPDEMLFRLGDTFVISRAILNGAVLRGTDASRVAPALPRVTGGNN